MRILLALIGIGSMLLQQATRVDAPVRQVVINVVDARGRMVDGLQAKDFILQENGDTKQISRFLPGSEVPISIGVLIDTSLSMGVTTVGGGGGFGGGFRGGFGGGVGGGGLGGHSPKWAAALGATRAVLRLTKPQDEFQLMTFDNSSRVIQGFTADHNKIESYLREIAPNGLGTNISGAVDNALKEMRKSAHAHRGLIVITDVEDNEGGGLPALRRSLHSEEIPVYIFAMRPEGQVGGSAESSAVDQTLKTVSREGEGQNLVMDVNHLQNEQTAVKIVEFVTAFTEELRGQYTIGYDASAPDDSGLKPALRIRTVSPDLTVHFRQN